MDTNSVHLLAGLCHTGLRAALKAEVLSCSLRRDIGNNSNLLCKGTANRESTKKLSFNFELLAATGKNNSTAATSPHRYLSGKRQGQSASQS